MPYLKTYIITIICGTLLAKWIHIIKRKKKYTYEIRYEATCLLLFYLPILIYTIFS